jgi:hypothetical protein
VITIHEDALLPITLDELVDRAGLLTRLDRKYLLPAAELPGVLAALPPGVRILEIDGRRRFAYRSAYFDTPALDSYLATARRRRRRFKLRVRSYLDSGEDFLEVKTRGARGVTVKQRLPYAGASDRLAAPAQDDARRMLTAAGVPPPGTGFELALITTYQRTTLFLEDSATRLTIDRDLAWRLPGGPALRLPRRVIVETKSAHAAAPPDRLLRSLAHRPSPVSKYATGLAALRPDLPANRWHLVLRRHFLEESHP